MFEQTTKLPFLLKWVAPQIVDGELVDLVPANRLIDKGGEPCSFDDEPELCHPGYTVPPDVRDKVDAFVLESIERWKAGTCDAPYEDDSSPEET